jgi:AraC family transcriptional regulator of adaptative response/methylated-DNA-[protein]-cysteine methyltransferase
MSQKPSEPRRYRSASERWAAVQCRDVHADGQFVYAVKSTGIFCHPSCASRPARPENVTFYASPDEAEIAGFRPCKRCRPGARSRDDLHGDAIARACALVAQSENPPSLEALAAAAGISHYHFHRLFKARMGLTPKAYVKAEQARRMREQLGTSASVTAAIYEAGYSSSSRFYETAEKRLGMTAKAFKAGGAGTQIRFAVGECSLGSILVAATARGICAIEFGSDPDTLVRGLQDRFPKAELIGADHAFEGLVSQVVGAVEAPEKAAALPLDVRGTAFQERVWRALQEIPVGQTATYSDIARKIGAPKSVRAVANACGSNPTAVAIPCHRVVRRNGSLGGYRWGIERKQTLIDREAA